MSDPICVSLFQMIAAIIGVVSFGVYIWLATKNKYLGAAFNDEMLPLSRNYILKERIGKEYAMLEDCLTGKSLVYSGSVPTNVRVGDTFVRSRATGGDIQWLVYAPVIATKKDQSVVSTKVAAMASGG